MKNTKENDNECLISNLTDMEKKIYVRNVLEYADVKESLMCERKYGRELGREEGLEQGREEGLEQGREEERRTIARNMLSEGIDPAIIAKTTGLTLKEIQALAQE